MFGCTAYAHIPKDERQKFDSKAQMCVLLGYELTKGYRLYESENKIVYSRDVRFDEQSNDTVVESKPEQNPDRAISIDSNEAKDEDNNNNEHSTCEQPPQPQADSPQQLRCSTRTRQPPMYSAFQICCPLLVGYRDNHNTHKLVRGQTLFS